MYDIYLPIAVHCIGFHFYNKNYINLYTLSSSFLHLRMFTNYILIHHQFSVPLYTICYYLTNNLSNLRITQRKCISWICRVNYVTLTSPMIFILIFFKVRLQIVVYHKLLVKLMQSEKDVNQLYTGLTALPCLITTPMNLTFKFQIKACNNLISIIRGLIDIAQAS